MNHGYPCPNPTCSHKFPAAAVAGVASLRCPRCGSVFQFHTGGGTGSRKLPVAAPAPRAVPALVPQAVPAPPPEPSLRPRYRANRGSGLLIPFTLLLIAVAAGLAGFAYYHSGGGFFKETPAPATDQGSPLGDAGTHQSDSYNFRYRFPANVWKIDDQTRSSMKSNQIALRRRSPDGWMVIVTADFEDKNPTEKEAVETVLSRMDNYFNQFGYTETQEAALGGKKAIRFGFRGQVPGYGEMVGECYVLIHQGLTYGVMTWAAEKFSRQLGGEFADLRDRFSLLNDRRLGWKDPEAKSEPQTFKGTKVPWSLADPDGQWQVNGALMQKYQGKAEMALHTNDPASIRYQGGHPFVLVLVYPKQPDLNAAAVYAKTEMEKMHKADYPNTKITVIKTPEGAALEGVQPINGVNTFISKMYVVNTDERQRYVMLLVIHRPEEVLAIHCECTWQRRPLWEQDFDQLMGSLQVR